MPDFRDIFKSTGQRLRLAASGLLLVLLILFMTGFLTKLPYMLGFGGISETERAAACQEAAEIMFAAARQGFTAQRMTPAERQAFSERVTADAARSLAAVAKKYGLRPEQIKGICETPKK